MALFQKLWDNYAYGAPCSTGGVRNYENQCAIRIGTTFVRNGVSLKNANLTMCSHHPRSAGHTLRARELAAALDFGVVTNVGPTKKYKGTEGWLHKLRSKTGIVYFRHYYTLDGTPDGELNGDHIDLWKRGSITDGWHTFWRLTVQDGGAYIREPYGSGRSHSETHSRSVGLDKHGCRHLLRRGNHDDLAPLCSAHG